MNELLDNQVSDINNQLSIIWDYVDDVFDENIVGIMFEQYKQLIHSFIETSEVGKVVIPDYDLKFIEKYNDTDNCLCENTLDQLFYTQLNEHPDKVCVVCDEKEYTYKELDIRSNKIANFLIEQGLQPAEYVGVIVRRHSDTIVNLLGILKAGGAYVPIEPSLPIERADYILMRCNSKICLDTDSFNKYDIGEIEDSQVFGYSNIDSIAYVIFTSGSTGNPKGVLVTHKSATNTIIDINRKFEVTQNDKIIGLSSMGFDLSVYDIFGALSIGATLYIVPDIRDVNNISDMISEHQITFWNSVPSVMNLLIESLFKSDKKFVKYECLKNVLLSGDWIPVSLPDKIKKYFPNSNVISLGGATEGSIWSIYYPINKIDSSWKSIPYGYPLSNQKMYVLNSNLDLCPLEVEGEIFIGGKGIAAGYISEKSKTEYSFINHPHLGYIYRTGDYGIMHRKGYIEFRGRKDSQVKIRGHRIELGEIECHLDNFSGIKHSVATVFEYAPGDKRIAAYYVKDGSMNTNSISNDELKDYLRRKLPQYMVPFTLVNIKELPLTRNQKVDRSKLPNPSFDENKYRKEVLQSLNLVEKKLLYQWKEIIELNDIGINDNFFDLGGDSLQAYQAVVSVEKEFGLKIPIAYLYKNPTISGIANYINENTKVEEIEKYNPKDSKTKIYWNPSCRWKISDEKLLIDGSLYPGIELFPKFYFLTQDGINIDDLYSELPSDKIDSLNSFLELSLRKGYVIKNLPDYTDLFKATEQFVSNPCDEGLILDPINSALTHLKSLI